MAQKDAASAPPALPTAALVLPAPLVLPALTSVRVVLRHAGALAQQVSALPHAVAAISSFLDYALPQFWSLPRACEVNLLSRLPHLAARILSAGVDPFFWKYQCRQGLVFAVKHDNLEMVELLHDLCPSVLPYLPMIEAAKTGNLQLLEWLDDRYHSAPWLPHMMDAAASTGQLHVLQWLHAHPKNAGCTRDAFGSAARGGYVDTVKWLLDHYPSATVIFWGDVSETRYSAFCDVVRLLFNDPWQFSVQLVNGTTWFAEKGDLEMVQWLYAKAKELGFMSNDKIIGRLIESAADRGHLHVVQWLHERHPKKCARLAMDNAARSGSLELVQWLHENRREGCTVRAMQYAAWNGHLDVVKWFHENRIKECTPRAMDLAASRGDLEIVKWLHENRTEGCTRGAMDWAAEKGHLNVVEWLHEHRTEGCSHRAMDEAAASGHLDVVQWLHENRTEGCTTQAMDLAAYNGHLDTIKWLHENRAEGCTTQAMDLAASNGHLEIVKWLHENRNEGCTTDAVRFAAANGRFEVLLFLHANRHEGCSPNVIGESEEYIQNMEITQWLHENYPDSVNVDWLASRGGGFGNRVLEHILGPKLDSVS